MTIHPSLPRVKPPAGLLIHSQRDHKKVIEDFLAQTMRNPQEVSSHATRLQPPAGKTSRRLHIIQRY